MTKLGAVLYAKKVMGSRILTDKEIKKVSGFEFKNYGSHIGKEGDVLNLFKILIKICLIWLWLAPSGWIGTKSMDLCPN